MKNFIFKILFFVLLSSISLMAIENCDAKYQCSIDGKVVKGVFYPKDLNCTLPNLPNLTIVAENVFDVNQTTGNIIGLKKYFGQNQTVCHILGWMHDGLKKFPKD